MKISTVGIDLAKHVFSIHGVDDTGKVVVQRELRRSQLLPFFARMPHCLIGMEACGGAHYWAREFQKLGHEVRLMPASYVKPYVKRGKNDARDAEAICEAVTRPTMRFVPVKSEQQQSALALHRARDMLVRQSTQTSNALRALCSEFGLIGAKGRLGIAKLQEMVADEQDKRLPADAKLALRPLLATLHMIRSQILEYDRIVLTTTRQNPACRQLNTVLGIGPLTATALVYTVGDAKRFDSGRDLSAWIGMTPKSCSSGGKHRVGSISKQGDQYLRRLLVQCAHSMIHSQERYKKYDMPWLEAIVKRRGKKIAAVALANKLARIAWAIMVRGENYRRPPAAAKQFIAIPQQIQEIAA